VCSREPAFCAPRAALLRLKHFFRAAYLPAEPGHVQLGLAVIEAQWSPPGNFCLSGVILTINDYAAPMGETPYFG